MTPRNLARTTLCALVLLATLLEAGPALANSWALPGPRYQGIGGTGVAYADDSMAIYWNPANLAWKRGWDVQLPATLDASIENRAIENLSTLVVEAERVASTIDAYLRCAPACGGTPADAFQQADMAELLVRIATYGTNGEAVYGNLDFGLTGRYDGFGFSAMSYTTGTVYPNVDLDSVGLDLAALGAIIGTNAGADPCCQVPLDSGLVNEILARPGVVGGGVDWEDEQVQHLVWLVEQAGGDTTDPALRQLLGNLVENTAQGTSPFATNGTGALVAGLSVQEFGLTYAHKLPVPYYRRTRGLTRRMLRHVHNRVSLGITAKYMLGITFLKDYRYDDTPNFGSIVGELTDNSLVSHNFGLDIGLSMHPVDWIMIGLTARNVNSPSFSVRRPSNVQLWPTVPPEISLDSTVRLGMAMVPIRNLTFAFDVDLTENAIQTLPGFTSRLVALGAEYDIPIGRNFGLALRLGGFTNVTEISNSDWSMTGGVGIELWSFVIDLSVGGSFDDEIVRTGTYTFATLPTRFNAGIGLKWDASF